MGSFARFMLIGGMAEAEFTPASVPGLASWLTPADAALPASASDGLTQLAWHADLPDIRPFPLLPSQSDVLVYAPSGATPDADNLGTAGRYNWHTRIWSVDTSTLLLMCSRGMNNEDSPGQRCYLHASTDGGATWGAGVQLVPSQEALAETSGTGRITWPACFAPNAAAPTSPYAILAIEDAEGGDYAGVALVARTVKADGTLGSLFRITTEDYTVRSGATKIDYDATLGPDLLAYWNIHGHWGGNIAGNQSWTVTYSVSSNHANERAVTPYPPDPTKWYAVWKNKGGFTANLVPCGRLNADGSIDVAPTVTDIPTAPNAPQIGTLTDSRIWLIDSPPNTGDLERDPLAVSFTDPGKSTFTLSYAIAQDQDDGPVHDGSFKGSASGYSDAVQVGDYLYASYGRWKEDLYVTKIPIPKQVQTWTDGAGRTLTAPSVAARPVRMECLAVGKELVYFDGGQVLSDDDLPGGTAGGCVFPVRPTRLKGTQTLIVVADTGSADNFWEIRFNGAFLEVVSSAGATVNVVRAAYRFACNTNYVVSVQSSGTAWTVRVNGVSSSLSVISGSNTGDWCGDVSSPNAYAVGARVTNTTGSYYRGWLGGVNLYAVAVSAGDLVLLEASATEDIGGLSATPVYLDEQFKEPAANLAAIDANAWAVTSGTGRVYGGRLEVTGATMVITADVGVSDYTATFEADAGNDNAQFYFRWIDENNHGMARTNSGNLQVYQRVAGSMSQIGGDGVGAPAQPNAVTVTVATDSVVATCGGVSVNTTLNSALRTATKVGFRGEMTSVVYKSVRVTG
jgi:hypothetical protein